MSVSYGQHWFLLIDVGGSFTLLYRLEKLHDSLFVTFGGVVVNALQGRAVLDAGWIDQDVQDTAAGLPDVLQQAASLGDDLSDQLFVVTLRQLFFKTWSVTLSRESVVSQSGAIKARTDQPCCSTRPSQRWPS